MQTYTKHRTEVTARIRDLANRLVGNTAFMIDITVHENGEEISGNCGKIFGQQREAYTGGDPKLFLDAVERFLETPVIVEVTKDTVNDPHYGMLFTLKIPKIESSMENFLYIGFPDMRAAFDFRLGEYGHLLIAMAPD